MADLDVDDLLEDLELELKTKSPTRPKPPPVKQPAPSTAKGAKKQNDVDDLLDDLDDVLADDSFDAPSQPPRAAPAPAPAPAPARSTSGSSSTPAAASTGKCFPVYIGGANDEQGMAPGRACNRLRCTKCDFEVKSWENIAWSDSCDYLFFRNFFPDGEKLKKNMVKTPGSRGYACQCTWKSSSELTALQKSPDMRWVCKGHTTPLA